MWKKATKQSITGVHAKDPGPKVAIIDGGDGVIAEQYEVSTPTDDLMTHDGAPLTPQEKPQTYPNSNPVLSVCRVLRNVC